MDLHEDRILERFAFARMMDGAFHEERTLSRMRTRRGTAGNEPENVAADRT
jgi:hypothetical protein